MPKLKVSKCLVCGNETLQGSTCALCRAGIPQIHKELIELLQNENPELAKKQKVSKR